MLDLRVVGGAAAGALLGHFLLRRRYAPPSASDDRPAASGDAQGSHSGPGRPLPSLAAADCLYLDWNATTPIFPEVTAAMLPFTAAHWGNPSSSNAFSAPCRAAVAKARAHIAQMLRCPPEDVVFTSCGTEADNTAIVLALRAAAARGAAAPPHVVTTEVEHPAIEQCLLVLEQQGDVRVTRVPVDHQGLVSAAAVLAAVQPDTALVTVMHSNNEVGAVMPTAQIADGCRVRPRPAPAGGALLRAPQARGVLFHTDAAQSCGKVPVNVECCAADMITVVGHKFGAPKGIAALYVRSGCLGDVPGYGTCGGMLQGGGQEAGRRVCPAPPRHAPSRCAVHHPGPGGHRERAADCGARRGMPGGERAAGRDGGSHGAAARAAGRGAPRCPRARVPLQRPGRSLAPVRLPSH